jgi:hypothetical protein
VSDKSKGIENWLEIVKNLSKVIDLFKSSLLAYAVDKNKRTFIAVTNCSPGIDRSYMATVELMLNIVLTISL